MITKAKKIILHPLFSGSALMIVGSNGANALNYLYHLVMGRSLGPVGYGELTALISLMGLLGIIPFSLGLVITKYVSSAKDDVQRRMLINWLGKKVSVLALLLFLIVAIVSPVITVFLRLSENYFVPLTALILAITLMSLYYRAVLQGLLRFKQLVFSLIVENSTKLIFGLLLVYWGLSVGGAILGFTIAAVLGLTLSYFFTRDFLSEASKIKPDSLPTVRYSIPVVLQSVALTSFYSTDVVLVKHFLSPQDAGIYAALSTLGKIIFFGASPIASVMFPIVSSRLSKSQSYNNIFWGGLFLTVAVCLLCLGVYSLWPSFAIQLLYGSTYLSGSGLLSWMAVFIVLLTLSSYLIYFYLSLGKSGVVVLPVAAALIQAVGIWFYHGSLMTIITISITASFILFLGLIIYTLIFRDIKTGTTFGSIDIVGSKV